MNWAWEAVASKMIWPHFDFGSAFQSLLSRFVQTVHAPWSNWAIEKRAAICHFRAVGRSENPRGSNVEGVICPPLIVIELKLLGNGCPPPTPGFLRPCKLAHHPEGSRRVTYILQKIWSSFFSVHVEKKEQINLFGVWLYSSLKIFRL